MDEWTADSLSCEDAKRILQGLCICMCLTCYCSLEFSTKCYIKYPLGGLIVVPQKHKESVTSHYNSGFFITTNNYPDFGGGRDGEAIKRRLCVFQTKALRKKDANVSGELVIFLKYIYI